MNEFDQGLHAGWLAGYEAAYSEVLNLLHDMGEEVIAEELENARANSQED